MFLTVALWLAILNFSLAGGGAVYEFFVITPLWTRDPPASVRGWNQDPARRIERKAFWGKGTGGLFLLSPLLQLAATVLTDSPARGWSWVATGCGLALIPFTLGYFIRVQKRTLDVSGEGATDEAIVRDVKGWVFWGRLRWVLLAVGWVAAIQALALHL